MQDATAGIYVEGSISPTFEHHWGDMVEVDGVTGPGKFAPVIREQRFRFVSRGTLPPSHVYPFTELATGQQDSQWVQVRGIVRSVSIDRTSWPETVLAMTVTSQWGMDVPYTFSKGTPWGTPADTYSGSGGPRVIQLGAKVYF